MFKHVIFLAEDTTCCQGEVGDLSACALQNAVLWYSIMPLILFK